MKVAHVNYLPTYLPGIHKKVIEQALAAKNSRFNIDYYILNTVIQESKDNIYEILIKYSTTRFLSMIQKKYFRYLYIMKLVPLKQYDLIILRYPLAMGLFWKKFYKMYGNKIISEHHTIEETQLRKHFNNVLLSFIVAKIESYNKKWLLRNILGHIGVTPEIVMHNWKLSSNSRCCVFSNGINVNNMVKYKMPPLDNKISFIFVASRFAPWHALDRVIEGAKNYEGKLNINIYLVGNIVNKDEQKLLELFYNPKVNIITTGLISGLELDEVFARSHMAISSLGLHRIEMKEACVIKTREYLARGIPFIYAYDDPDLSGKEPFAIKIQQDDSPLELDRLINRYNRTLGDGKSSVIERKYAEKVIDWQVKLSKLGNFLNITA